MYRPPRSNANDFLLEVERECDEHKKMIIVGDMNINLLQDSTTCTNYKTMLETYNYKNLNNISEDFPTRSTATSCSIIDHVISDFPLSRTPKEIRLLDTYISDHKALLFEVEINVSKKKSQIITKEFKRINNQKYIQLAAT